MKCVVCGGECDGTFCTKECYKDYMFSLKQPLGAIKERKIYIKEYYFYYESITHNERWLQEK